MKSRKKIVKELQSARGRAATAAKRIEKAGATKALAYQALQRRGGIGTTVKGKSTQELRQELKSLNKFLKSQVATKEGLYQSQHRRPGKEQYQKATETKRAQKRWGVSRETLETANQKYEQSAAIITFPKGMEIDKLKRPELQARLEEIIPMIKGQQKYLQMKFGETPATTGLDKAGNFPDDLSNLSYNELRMLGWRANNFINAKTSTYAGAEYVLEQTLLRLEKAHVNIRSLGTIGSDQFNKNISDWFEIMHNLQMEFPDIYFYKTAQKQGYAEGSTDYKEEVVEVVNNARRKKKLDFSEMLDIAKADLAQRREQKMIEMFGGLDGYTKSKQHEEDALQINGEDLLNGLGIPAEFGTNPITKK